jgi:TRAP-type uncharacterized transport system fused permease subunit
VHLFILYWSMISFITPPVALTAFAAAPIAKTGHFRIGWQAMKLGTIIYIIPFVFVLNPALVLRGAWHEIVLVTGTAFAGVFVVASAMQGYMIGLGIMPSTVPGWIGRALLLIGGIGLVLPGGDALGWGLGRVGLDVLGLAVAVAGALVVRAQRVRPAVV